VRTENRLALFGGSTALLTLILFIVGVRQVTRQQNPERPDPRKTPGLAVPVTVAEVCASRSEPAIPQDVRKSVFDHYGIDRPKPEDYELDLLIPAALGGTNDPRNLWPQPIGHIEWNARIKNALEEHLRELVCDRQVPVEEAQAALSKDWIAAYQKYFHVRLPLSRHQRR